MRLNNILLGYNIQDKYYMVGDINVDKDTKECGVGIYKVWFGGETEDHMIYVTEDEIRKIYKEDKDSVEIYKLQVDKLVKRVENLEENMATRDDLIDVYEDIRRSRNIVDTNIQHDKTMLSYELDFLRMKIANNTETMKVNFQKMYDKTNTLERFIAVIVISFSVFIIIAVVRFLFLQ